MEALSKFIQTIFKDLLTHNYFANREDQVEIPHNVAFHQGLHCFLGLKQYWDEEIKFKLEIITSYHFICTMNAPISSERTHHNHDAKGY